MSDVIAIIPARSGSKSFTDKNVTSLSGHPLMAYSIAAAQLSKRIKRVIVSTDSAQYAEIAVKYGVEVSFLRPPEFSTDTSTDRDFLVHAMEWFYENEQQRPEYWVHLRPTTPLRNPLLIDQAIKTIEGKKESTSLRSVHKAPETPFKWFKKDHNGNFKGILSEEHKTESYNLPNGYDHKYIYSHPGYNLKITDMQAACGLAQLEKVSTFIQRRKENFLYLSERLASSEEYFILPKPTPNSDPSWFGFPMTIREKAPFNRVDLLKYLDQSNIGTRLLFAGNLIHQPYMIGRNYRVSGELKNTNVVMNKSFWIGVYPALTEEMLDFVAEKIEQFIKIVS